MILDSNKEKDISLSYTFNEREIKVLARLFRKNQAELPLELEDFAFKIEQIIYNSMSIEEVETFYS